MFPRETEIITPEVWRKACGDGQAPRLVGVDFETFYSSKYSVRQLGNYAYCQDPRFKAYLVAVSDGEQTCVCPPAEFPWETIAGVDWVSHHRDFDRAVYRRLVELGIVSGDTCPANWHCSAALCAYLQLPRELAAAVREVFGAHIEKETRGRLRGKEVEADLLGFPEDVLRYAATDAEACLALWRQLAGAWPAHEQRLLDLTSNMGTRGLCMDWEHVKANRQELEELVTALASGLPWSPPLSIKQFRLACDAIGVRPPKSTSASNPRFLQWIENHVRSEAATWVRHMQRIRSANRTAKVLESMLRRRKGNGRSSSAKASADRMAYELKYFGASTGRWSGGGGLNLQNLNRKEAQGVDLRRAIVAPPGHRLAVVDYSQIESRVLLYLAGDNETLEMFRSNPDADAYEIHARATMGYAEAEPLKAYCERTGSNLRQLAKARVLGLGFGCGWERFIEVAKVMAGLDLYDDESERIVKEFRKSNPKVVALWRRLNNACASCDGGSYVLPLPCTQVNPELKRFLIYRDVHADKDGIDCTVSGDHTYAYGGLLAENWTQATARDVMASAWLRCADAGYEPVLSVHDELVFEVAEESAEADLARIVEIMEAPLAWASGLPLRADGRLCEVYGK